MVAQLNEHSLSASRAACIPNELNLLLQNLRDLGEAESDLDNIDYRLDTEETQEQVGVPDLHWLSDDSFIVEISLGIIVKISGGASLSFVSDGDTLGRETFNFKVPKTATGWGSPGDCNANPGPYPSPVVSTIRAGGSATVSLRDKVQYLTTKPRNWRNLWFRVMLSIWMPLPFSNYKRWRFSPKDKLAKYTFKTAILAEERPRPNRAH